MVTKGEIIVDAGPRWMIGKTKAQVKPWLIKKKAKGVEVKGVGELIDRLNLELCD